MGLLTKLVLIAVLGTLLVFCFRKLIFAWYEFCDLWQAKKHPADFFHTDGIVFNKKTQKLEESSRPILPSE